MSTPYRPLSPEAVVHRLADLLAARAGVLRVGIDGAPCAAPEPLAAALAVALRVRGRPVAHIRAEMFWRDAALRLERGREDADAYASWLDTDALRREVLDPIIEHGTFLPSLRDPLTNRATREPPRTADVGTVLLVSGTLLLGRGLPFDLVIHLAVSAPARARRTDTAQAWTLPAFERYDAEVGPVELADVVIKIDDPRHPAIGGLAP